MTQEKPAPKNINQLNQATNKNEKTSQIKKNSVWSPNCFTLFVVSKTTRKHGQNWVHYYLKNNPKQKYHCYEQAFLQRFTELTNIY